MHFWIDKRSQACGFNGRYQIPPSISGYGRNQRNLCHSFYPKPMVTPVHRFQSIESVANNGLRYSRSPGYHHHRQQYPSGVHYTCATNNIRVPAVQNGRPIGIVSPTHTSTARTNNFSTSAKFQCVVWVLFAFITFFLVLAKYFFPGINIEMETLAFCSLLVAVLLMGCLIAVFGAMTTYSNNNPAGEAVNVAQLPDQEIEETQLNRVPSTTALSNSSELPPPPYHIAIMLTPQNNDINAIQVIRDSPPPTYDKAVT